MVTHCEVILIHLYSDFCDVAVKDKVVIEQFF